MVRRAVIGTEHGVDRWVGAARERAVVAIEEEPVVSNRSGRVRSNDGEIETAGEAVSQCRFSTTWTEEGSK